MLLACAKKFVLFSSAPSRFPEFFIRPIRKIILTALLFLACQTAHAQSYSTMEYAIMKAVGDRYVSYSDVQIFRVMPTAVPNQYIAFVYFPHRFESRIVYTCASYSLYESLDGWRALGNGSVYYTDSNGELQTRQASPPAIFQGASNRLIYSYADVEAWYTESQQYFEGLPRTTEALNAFYHTNYSSWSVSGFAPNLDELTQDTDGGGMGDWDEIYRQPRASSITYSRDDVDCSCSACCSCECICGGYHVTLCGGTASDCDCHKPLCSCGACCSCNCVCGGRWLVLCDGQPSDCTCHEECTCGACCECKCICGKWHRGICLGTVEGLGNGVAGCACHAECSCGACCSCTCTCGDWSGESCGGDRTDCRCHRHCECNACCSCRCTCGDWTGPTCNGGSYCDCHSCTCGACCSCRCTCGNWPTSILGECGGTPEDCDCHHQCSCGACCQCRCVCGDWQGGPCNGTAQYCACHGCQCDACCSCRCTCGQWYGAICGGQQGDCSCHSHVDPPDEPETCTCGACCSCNCVCGKWHLQTCGKTPEYCSCHEPIEGEDWYPTTELQSSFIDLQAKLKEKFNFDLPALLDGVQTSQFPVYSFNIPSFVSGQSSFMITVDVEDLLRRYSSIVSLFRQLMLGGISFAFYMAIFRLLFKF